MSFRRALFDQIGGFREGLGRQGSDAYGCEETEFCIRAAAVFPRSKIVCDPAMAVSHQLANSRTTWRYFRTRCLAEGRSKALVVNNVGISKGLSSELRYTVRLLPAGIARAVGDAMLSFDVAGFARAGAILVGLSYTSWGYLRAKLSSNSRKSQESPKEFLPIKIVDLDIAHPLPQLEACDPMRNVRYGGVFCLVRSAGRPIKAIEIPFDGEQVSSSKLQAILANEIRTPLLPPRTIHPEAAPFISVVVATRDRPASLSICIDSLLRQNYPRFEVLVVDNAPASSATAELVASRYAPTGRVRYLCDDRPGLGHAHNYGVANVTAPVVAFTDDDVIVDPHWLAALASDFNASSKVGCVTGLILPAELDTRAQFWTERHGGFGKGFERRVYDLLDNRPSGRLFPYAAGQFGSGANMAFSRVALQRAGAFDSALGAGTLARGGDDLAAFVSVVRAGYTLVYEPEAIVWHCHRRGEEGMRRQAFSYGVGLGAYLTKVALDEPTILLHFARALPAAFKHLLSPSSPKNYRLPDDYPGALIWRERLGILAGVPAYFRSRAALRRPLKKSRSDVLSSASPNHQG
jgi:GT2 family glycosyltransferase